MSQARNTTIPDERGRYRVWCEPCDAEDTFPDLVMAIQARRMHLCEGEVASCSWPGWEDAPADSAPARASDQPQRD